jgi:hypothetical protein
MLTLGNWPKQSNRSSWSQDSKVMDCPKMLFSLGKITGFLGQYAPVMSASHVPLISKQTTVASISTVRAV